MSAALAASTPWGGQNPTYATNFTPPDGAVITADWINQTNISRISKNPQYAKEVYHATNQSFGIFEWIETMGMRTECKESWTIPHFFPTKNWFDLKNAAAITIAPITVVGGTPTTAVIPWPSALSYIGGQYINPSVNSTLVFGANRKFEVVSIAAGAAGVKNITVKNKDYTTATVITPNSIVKVFHARELEDCACPSGTVPQEEGPLLEDINWYQFQGGTHKLCGEALDTCLNQIFPFTYTDENGCVQSVKYFHNQMYHTMIKEHKAWKKHQLMTNPDFGIITKIAKYGISWNWNDPDNLTVTDCEEFNQLLITNNIPQDTFTFWVENKAYTSAQRFKRAQGILNNVYTVYDPTIKCKDLNLDFCDFTYNGIKYIFMLERGFSDPASIGGPAYTNKGIGVPMGARTMGMPCTEEDHAMGTVVYFKPQNGGEIQNEVVYSNGVLNDRLGIPRSERNGNSFKVGCIEHEWSMRTKMTYEMHMPSHFVNLNGLPK